MLLQSNPCLIFTGTEVISDTIDESTHQKWKSSLALNQTFLTTEMSLIPIFDLVEVVDGRRSAACREALHDFLGGKFTIYRKLENEADKIFLDEKLLREEETNRQKAAQSVLTSLTCFPATRRAQRNG